MDIEREMELMDDPMFNYGKDDDDDGGGGGGHIFSSLSSLLASDAFPFSLVELSPTPNILCTLCLFMSSGVSHVSKTLTLCPSFLSCRRRWPSEWVMKTDGMRTSDMFSSPLMENGNGGLESLFWDRSALSGGEREREREWRNIRGQRERGRHKRQNIV